MHNIGDVRPHVVGQVADGALDQIRRLLILTMHHEFFHAFETELMLALFDQNCLLR